jgi:Tol biopolymer transport system component/DNA-binding winged helix-turn-helix (wHTH) protein
MYIAPPEPPASNDTTTSPSGYTFGEFTVDVASSKLMKDATIVSLPSRTFDVLVYLIRHRERSVKKDEIISAIWDNVIVTDDSLIHAISVLRRALGDEAHQHKYIETIPRRGYRFVGTVQVIEARTAQVAPTAKEASAAREAPAATKEPLADVVQGLPEEPVAPAVAVHELAAPYGIEQAARAPRVSPRALWVLATAVVLAVLSTSTLLLVDQPSAAPVVAGSDSSVRLFQPSPPGMSIVSGGVLSPDGRYLAFVARDDENGATGLWVRALQAGEPRLVKGTDGATKPFWAPDSSCIGFFSHGTLFTTDLGGAQVHRVAVAAGSAGATWGPDGTILFADWANGLYAVPASGDGAITAVLPLDRAARDIAYAWPQFFPGSSKFLYQVVSLDAERAGAYVGDMQTRESYKILDTSSSVTFAPPYHLLHVRQNMLIAEEIDPERLELTGHAIVVARDISEPDTAVDNFVSASAHLLAFRQGIKKQNLVWFDRGGEQLQTLATATVLYNPRLSPDGMHLLGSSSVTSDPGLWLTRVDREEFARIETDAIAPIWSPDGQRIAFTSRDGADMLVRSTAGEEATTLLMRDDQVKVLNDWTPDGAYIVYSRQGEQTGLDLWIVEIATGAVRPLLASAHNETQARISPDGKWLAFTSDESGTQEIYVARFPDFEDRQQVSNGGGGQAQWRADQGELFYLAPDHALTASAVNAGEMLTFGSPQSLFRTAISGNPGNARDYYAANATGTQFLIDADMSAGNNQEISIMVNWAARFHDSGPRVAQASAPR